MNKQEKRNYLTKILEAYGTIIDDSDRAEYLHLWVDIVELMEEEDNTCIKCPENIECVEYRLCGVAAIEVCKNKNINTRKAI